MRLANLPTFAPRLRMGVWEYPVHYTRCGTSTGLVLWEPFVPAAEPIREELLLPRLRHRMPGYLPQIEAEQALAVRQRAAVELLPGFALPINATKDRSPGLGSIRWNVPVETVSVRTRAA